MARSAFEIERIRLDAARSLPAQCFDDFLRLSQSLLHGPVFQWLLVDAPHELLRKEVMAALERVLRAAGLSVDRLPLGGSRIPDVATLEIRLRKSARAASVVQVIVPRGWFDAARWDAFNVRRERIAAGARTRLVFWLDAEAIALASRGAPDLWAWRSGVYAFMPRDSLPGTTMTMPVSASNLAPGPEGPDNRSMAERNRRIAEIRGWLDGHPDAPDDLLAGVFDELGRLLVDLGDYDAALIHFRERELPLHQRRGGEHDAAVTQCKIGDILMARGQLDEALRILGDEVLPAFERLGDVREKAVTQGKIGDILMARGQLDEALRIRKEEELPVYERLGDVRAKAVTQGKIGDILMARGQLDEALRIRKEEELPVYERLGDVRAKAVTQGKIGDILMARGQLDEALRILGDEVLPAFERLGDVRAKAVTQGQIGDILMARGQLDEALRIRKEEELPVYERLGDVRAKAVTQGKIGDILMARGQLDEALRIRKEEELPVYERLGDVREKAVTQGQIGDILMARGQLDEALRILGDEVLPAFERLGDVRAKAVTQGKIGDILMARGQLDEALALHEARLPVAERMGDIEAIAHIRYSMANIRLQRGDDKRGGLQSICEDLAQAFALLRTRGHPRGLGVVGLRLAEVLAMRGLKDEALAALDEAAAASKGVGDTAGVAKADNLRRAIAGDISSTITPRPDGRYHAQ